MVFSVTVIIAIVSAMIIGRYAGPIGTTLGLMDHPDANGGRKRHVRVTPLVGGVAVTVAFLASVFVTLSLVPGLSIDTFDHLGWLAAAVAAMFMIGAADDRFSLGPLTRLVVALLILLPVVVFAPGFSLSVMHFTGAPGFALASWVGISFSLLCLLALLNAVNMADGKNGIVISLGLIWSVLLMARLPAELLPITAAVAASLAVLLVFNMTNRLFLGDGGSYAVSAFFGLLAIYGYNHDLALRADDIALMFAIPVFDTARLIVVRSLQRQSPFQGGRDHLHHFLFARVGWPTGLFIFVTLAGVPNFASLLMPGTTLFWLLISAVAYGWVVWWAQGSAVVAVTSVRLAQPVPSLGRPGMRRMNAADKGPIHRPKRASR